MITPVVGTPAPNFTLVSHDGSLFILADEVKKHQVVLVFYPMDSSPICDNLLSRINKDVDEFAAAGLKIVGINFAEPDAHGRYTNKKSLRMPLLSDQRFRVAEAYDSLFSIGPIKVIRYSVVGIDKNGLIKYFKRGRPDNAEIIAGMQTSSAIVAPNTESLLQ